MHRYRTTYLRRVLRTAPDQAAGLLGYLWCLGKIKNRPVHFHLDILPPYQRQGWGTRLMDTLCCHLRELGVDYLSCCGVSRDAAGYKMYRKYGFTESYDYGHNTVSLSLRL